jgi:hypothetical protein
MTVTIRLEGTDAMKALAELISNIQYDKLNATVTRINVKRIPKEKVKK